MLDIIPSGILVSVGIIFAALIFIGFIIARLYRRSSKEISFVRTGFGGEKVILGGGAIVLPVLHEIIPVNMNTLRLEVRRADDQALITRDRMRVDVMAEFYVRVKPTADSIATAAQTLGQKTMSPNELKNLVEGNSLTLYVQLPQKWRWKSCMKNVSTSYKKFSKWCLKIYIKTVWNLKPFH
jgi:Uncharacterized protein conserved in bacteria